MPAAGSLPTPPADDPEASRAWVADHLGDLCLEEPEAIAASPRFRGGQREADRVLVELDVRGYASRRNQVLPVDARGATAVSPYVRHGLLGVRRLWDHVSEAPARDRTKYRDELLWQEYARHLYARLGRATAGPLRYAPARPDTRWPSPWPAAMQCMRVTVEELEGDGWLVNQTRMWMSSQWTVRAGSDWREGEDHFFAHLLDGSRAANRLGWQWTIGAGTGKPYGFSRWQVRKRAAGLCETCELNRDCPIDGWPEATRGPKVAEVDPRLRSDPDVARSAGPSEVEDRGEPDCVWLTAESLGDADPALAASPDRPVVFVFDEPLLAARGRAAGAPLRAGPGLPRARGPA